MPTVLFERDEFTAHDSAMTSFVLMGYALGLPAYVAVKVLSGAFWARQDTMSPVRVGIKSAAVNIVLAIVLSRFIGVAGIALATGIAGWVQFTLLYRGLRRQETAMKAAVQFDDRLRFVFPRIVMAAGMMAITVDIIAMVFAGWFGSDSTLKQLIALGTLIGGGAGVYGFVVTVSGALTIADLKRYFKRKELAQDTGMMT